MPETSRYCPKCGEACGWDDRFCTSCRTELRPTTPRVTAPSEPAADRFNADATELGLQPNAMLLNRYRVRKELGVGGMGRVYVAEDQKLGMPVAVKVLRDVLRQDPGSVKRLISEAKASMMLAHPNIVRMNNFEDGETTKFLVMEYVDGETLAHRIAREGKLPEDEVRRISIEICKGLEHAHSKRVIHRDLKPGNVLLGKDGSIKVADFGIARLCRDSMSRLTSQQDSGTLMYMAPEQLDGESNELTDLYSLGVVIYEMLSGDPPFITGEITAQIRYKAPREIPGLSPGMRGIVFKCLDKKPENRFGSIRELREELDGAAERRRAQQTEDDRKVEDAKAAAQKALDDARARAKEAQNAAEPGPAAQPEQQQNLQPKDDAGKQQRVDELKAAGRQACEAQQFGQAVALWEEALQLSPGDAGLAEALAEARRQAETLKREYEWKQWAATVLAQANELIRQGKYREAEGVLAQSLQHEPNNTGFQALLAQVRERLSQTEIQNKTAVPPVRRPKRSARKILALVVALVTVVSGLIYFASQYKPYVPPKQEGGDKPVNPPPPVIIAEPRPVSVTGEWEYTVTTPAIRITGRMRITGRPQNLQMVTMAEYPAVWSDGLWHRFREQNTYQGSFDGRNLAAQSFVGTLLMDGYQIPAALPIYINLEVSSDGFSMRGSGSNSSGLTFNVTAQKQVSY